MKNNIELLGLSANDAKELRMRLGKFRGYTGISINITEVKDSNVKVSVEQISMRSGWILNRKELVERADDVLKSIKDQFKIKYNVLLYKSDFSEITKPWIKSKMKKFGLNQSDVCANLGLDKGTLSDILSPKSVRTLTRFQKSTFYFYFTNFELNKNFREYIKELERYNSEKILK